MDVIRSEGAYSFRGARRAALLAALLLCVFPAFGLDVPDWSGPVLDMADVIPASDESELRDYLVTLNDQTGVQMAVLTVPSLAGDAIEDFSIRVAQSWGLGQKDSDNGALLVVSVDDRQLRIETGYGLEHLLTDAKCGLIIRNVIAPHFRSGDYASGIISGIKNMAGIATDDAELVADSVSGGGSGSDRESVIIALIFFGVFFLIVTAGVTSSVRSGKSGRSGNRTVVMPTSTFGGSGFGSGSAGRGGFGSSGGGGFRGGGGSFGGGGASGGW